MGDDSSLIANSRSTGNVGEESFVNRLAGANTGDLENCFAIGNIAGSHVINAGALPDHNESSITKSY